MNGANSSSNPLPAHYRQQSNRTRLLQAKLRAGLPISEAEQAEADNPAGLPLFVQTLNGPVILRSAEPIGPSDFERLIQQRAAEPE